MTDSAVRSIIDKANAAEIYRLLETERFVEEQKIKKAHAPDLWAEVKAQIKLTCESITAVSPASIIREEHDINSLTLRNGKTGQAVSVNFSVDEPCILYEGPVAGRKRISFGVSADGNSVRLLMNEIPYSAEEIAIMLTKRVTGAS